jgi:hypothetical protein
MESNYLLEIPCQNEMRAATGSPIILLEIPCHNEKLDKEASTLDQPAD